MSSLGDARRVTGRRRGGGGGFEETARRRTKAKQQEYFVGARLFLGHVATSWSNELQSLASSPGDPAGSSVSPYSFMHGCRAEACRAGRVNGASAGCAGAADYKNNAATARRASLTRTLYVRHGGSRVHHFAADAARQDRSEQPRLGKALPRSRAEHDDLRLQLEHRL